MDKSDAVSDYLKMVLEISGEPKLDAENLLYYTTSLCGEAGEVAEKIKKFYRDDRLNMNEERRQGVGHELGDVLYCVVWLARRFGFSLEEVMEMNARKLRDRESRGMRHGDGDHR